jgi:hypothetical protein
MNRFCRWLVALAVALVAGFVGAQDKPKPPDRPPGPGSGQFPYMRPLIPPGLFDRLGLSAKQKEQIEKLQKEFGEKQRETFTKMRESFEKASKEGKEAITKFQEEAKETMQKQFQEAEAKLKEILNEEQQNTLEQMKKEGPAAFSGPPPGAYPMMAFRMFPGQILPPPVQEMLKLTPEQKEKISRIQKEAEEKVLEVLTEEQKKRIEELKRRGPGAAPPAPPREPR